MQQFIMDVTPESTTTVNEEWWFNSEWTRFRYIRIQPITALHVALL